jgi:hypothetical protein
MSSDDKPNKPMPSVAVINEYLERSAARTKKRLPLAMGKSEAPKQPTVRKLSVTTEAADKSQSSDDATATEATEATEKSWRPFSVDSEE